MIANAPTKFQTMKSTTNAAGPLLAVLLAAAALSPLASAAESGNLISNGDCEKDSKAQGWPDHWPRLNPGGTWESEKGNHFIRMKSTVPGKLVMLQRVIEIPAGTKALELAWRWRVTDLKPGKLAWNDARS
jgi:hypothetical protein